MFEAYTSLQGQAAQCPLVLSKQGADAHIGFDPRSMKPKHGELVGASVHEAICQAVVVVKINRQ